MEERGGFFADEVDAAAVVDVVDGVPANALGSVLLLQEQHRNMTAMPPGGLPEPM